MSTCSLRVNGMEKFMCMRNDCAIYSQIHMKQKLSESPKFCVKIKFSSINSKLITIFK